MTCLPIITPGHSIYELFAVNWYSTDFAKLQFASRRKWLSNSFASISTCTIISRPMCKLSTWHTSFLMHSQFIPDSLEWICNMSGTNWGNAAYPWLHGWPKNYEMAALSISSLVLWVGFVAPWHISGVGPGDHRVQNSGNQRSPVLYAWMEVWRGVEHIKRHSTVNKILPNSTHLTMWSKPDEYFCLAQQTVS
jgi:hypothetical protein